MVAVRSPLLVGSSGAGGGGGGRSSGSFELGTSFSQDHLGLAWRTCVEYEGGMWSLVYVVA